MIDNQVPFLAQWQKYKARANEQIKLVWPHYLDDTDAQLAQAMQYSLENGGKRFRAMLLYASGSCFGADLASLDGPAVAIELIHAYSLVHDDLPAMDDDDIRRGKASCHVRFDEATAVLVGDALQSLAFEILAQTGDTLTPAHRLKMISRLARASGAVGMAGGQSLDMIATGKQLELASLRQVHERKTGALIRAALVLGALGGQQTSVEEIKVIDEYGRHLGLAFQVVDDILDQTQSSEKLGKPSGADAALSKSTYPGLMGLNESKQYAAQLVQSAKLSLGKIGRDTHFLQQLAEFTYHRDH